MSSNNIFFAYFALIAGTSIGSFGQFFNFRAQSQNITGIWMDLICANLPIHRKTNVNKKSWDTPHVKDNLILIIFYLKIWLVWALLLQICVVKVTDDVIVKNIYISSQNFTNLCLNCSSQVKVWIHTGEGRGGGSKAQSFLKMTHDEIPDNLSKFLAIYIINKPTKEVIFSKAVLRCNFT